MRWPQIFFIALMASEISGTMAASAAGWQPKAYNATDVFACLIINAVQAWVLWKGGFWKDNK